MKSHIFLLIWASGSFTVVIGVLMASLTRCTVTGSARRTYFRQIDSSSICVTFPIQGFNWIPGAVCWLGILIYPCLRVTSARLPPASVWLLQALQPQSFSQCVGVCMCVGGCGRLIFHLTPRFSPFLCNVAFKAVPSQQAHSLLHFFRWKNLSPESFFLFLNSNLE